MANSESCGGDNLHYRISKQLAQTVHRYQKHPIQARPGSENLSVPGRPSTACTGCRNVDDPTPVPEREARSQS